MGFLFHLGVFCLILWWFSTSWKLISLIKSWRVTRPDMQSLLPVHLVVKYDFRSCWPPGTIKEMFRTSGCIHKEEGMCVNDYGENIIICVSVTGKSINIYIKYSKWIGVLCTQHTWYFRGDIPSSIQPNKECLLLNTTLMLKEFYF